MLQDRQVTFLTVGLDSIVALGLIQVKIELCIHWTLVIKT